jgi:cyclic-di-GMP phosphodiesterase TipF (flagellum assembly factor)
MDRIIAALIFCFMLATAVAIAVGARTIFDLPLLASILIAGFLLLIFSLTQGLAMQRKHHARLEAEIDSLAEEVAAARKGWSAWNSRLKVCEERVDLLAEDLGKAEDYQARTDIAELSALIKDIVEAMGDVDIRLQNHGRLLTSLPSQRPQEPALVKPLADPDQSAADAIEDRNMDATKLSALRRALNSNAVTFEYQSVVHMPRRQIWAGFATAKVQVPGERDQVKLRKIAAENGLLPCIDLLTFTQAAKGSMVRKANGETAPVICQLNLESLLPNPFSDAFEEALETQRDNAHNIILEFPDRAITGQLAANARDSESTALRARLRRYARWGYSYALHKNARVGLAADYGMLAELGFRYVRISAHPLINALTAIEKGEPTPFDLHPADLAGLVGRYGMELVIDDLENESMVLEALELNAAFAMGSAFAISAARRAS